MRLITMWLDKWEESSLTVLNAYLTKIRLILNNRLEFQDNFYCDYVTFTASGNVGTSHTIAHDLNRVPEGYLVYTSLSGTTFGSGATWTSSNIYLKSITLGAGETDTITMLIF